MRLLPLRLHFARATPKLRRCRLPESQSTNSISTQSRTKTMSHSGQDYNSWSNADLIGRVTELEAQLRAQNIKHPKPPSSNVSPGPPKKKPKKPSKPFDPTKYSTRFIALKFAYLGKRYNGFEYHSNSKTPLPTIEEELWKALRKTRLIFPAFKDGQSEDGVCWDGCEYSKCGRTDRGVSAFGQVIGVRVRSCRPKERIQDDNVGNGDSEGDQTTPGADADSRMHEAVAPEFAENAVWDPIKDELPYIQMLNRVLPPDIRILAWCPNPPPNFSARFSCKERRYRYFFTNPAYAPVPGENERGAWLDIEAMQQAAKKLEGLHDFRNFCKIDPSKQISSFDRRIFHASIERVKPDQGPGAFLTRPPFFSFDASVRSMLPADNAALYYFEVRGSAFLWHQVRHMIAVLFLVGQGYEAPGVVDKLLDVQQTPARPIYDMASDTPLVLWDCIFPDPDAVMNSDHGSGQIPSYQDALVWLYVGDSVVAIQSSERRSTGVEDRKYGRLSIMDDLWAMWWKRKMDEVLAGSLMDVFARQGKSPATPPGPERLRDGEVSARVFDGSESPRTVGRYTPIMKRERMDNPDVVNARYAVRKGLNRVNGDAVDMDE